MSIEDRFEEHDEEYLEFDRIPTDHRLHPDPTLCGYLKIHSLLVDPRKDVICGADHDIIYLPGKGDMKPLTDDDIVYLQRCGIHWDAESHCLADFC